MKKILHHFKLALSIFFKIIIAVLMGLGLSLGNKPMEIEHKDNKKIESNK